MFDLEDSVHKNSFNPVNQIKRKLIPKKTELEVYIDILKILIHNGPLRLSYIKHKNDFSPSCTEENLVFLVNLNLVEKIFEGGQTLFSITRRGTRVLTFFGETKGLLSVLQINK